MAVIVELRKTKKRFVLLGAGYGAYKATRPSFFGGDLFPKEEEGIVKAVAVSDSDGNIRWINSNKLKVIEIDGVKIEKMKNLLETDDKYQNISNSLDKCPGCGEKVSLYDKECPDCGLTLIDSDYEKISEIAKNKKL
ncbi:hypothetical protein [Sporosalibacterium faouarense]|uniref:hypothetical protein n=1 Tax=Sporosalibacterium faouarense TaxID=516123 RepID=UPI00141C9011|nr:hypothetical protein [Sporosalibacterium faouarense]MTI49863.1 hypothetical protein [Bacillota bacterium]